jgi:hypothetical protein
MARARSRFAGRFGAVQELGLEAGGLPAAVGPGEKNSRAHRVLLLKSKSDPVPCTFYFRFRKLHQSMIARNHRLLKPLRRAFASLVFVWLNLATRSPSDRHRPLLLRAAVSQGRTCLQDSRWA